MADETTALTDESTTLTEDPKPDAGESTSVEGESKSELKPETAEPRHRGYMPDGSGNTYDYSTEELRQWAEHGMLLSAQTKTAGSVSEAEPVKEPEPEPEPESNDNEDPVMKELQTIRKGQEKNAAEVAEMRRERTEEKEQTRIAQQADQNRRQIDKMLTEHAPWSEEDKEMRAAIEGQAGVLRQQAMVEGEVMTVSEAVEKAAKWMGEKVGAANRTVAQDKKDVRATAVEAPGGVASVASMASTKPRTMEEIRKSAGEMTDGTAAAEAHDVWLEYQNAPAG